MTALVVEDGAGKSNADAYCSVSFASSYHAARGNDAWEDVDDPEAAIRKATDYMLQAYRSRWAGYRVTITQALDWPRDWVEIKDAPASLGVQRWAYYPNNVVPIEVQKACAELALKAVTGDLLADLGRPTIAEKVGDLEVQYASGARQTKRYPAIDAMLEPFLRLGSSSIQLVRA